MKTKFRLVKQHGHGQPWLKQRRCKTHKTDRSVRELAWSEEVFRPLLGPFQLDHLRALRYGPEFEVIKKWHRQANHVADLGINVWICALQPKKESRQISRVGP